MTEAASRASRAAGVVTWTSSAASGRDAWHLDDVSSTRRSSLAVVVGSITATAATCALLTACAGKGDMGDCVGRVRFDDVMYAPRYDVTVTRSARGIEIDRGEGVDCGTVDTAPAVASVRLVSIDGVDPSVAVLVPRGGWAGLYVAEGVERSAWPTALREAVRPLRPG